MIYIFSSYRLKNFKLSEISAAFSHFIFITVVNRHFISKFFSLGQFLSGHENQRT
jgi:hypothetical protein